MPHLAIPKRFRDRPLGQSLVEFALILPIFLVILSTAIDLGRIAYARVTIANVAREASFQAAQTPTSYLAGQPCASGNESANMVICRAILESTGSVITVAPADIALSCNPSCGEAMGNTVTVKATGRFNLITPFMAVFFGGTTISFNSSSTNQISAIPDAAGGPPPPPPPTTTVVPDLSGQLESNVSGLVSAANLIVGTRTQDYSPIVPVGSVLGQSPAPGTVVAQGSSVSYVVSTGPPPVVDCSLVSAGFTKTSAPATDRSPVTVTVTDTTTYNPACVTVWAWSWGDGVTTYGKTQPPHVYYNAGPGTTHFQLSLAVTSGTFFSTVGGYSIMVKP